MIRGQLNIAYEIPLLYKEVSEMIMNVIRYESVEKGFEVLYEIENPKESTKEAESFHCSHLYNTVLSKKLLEILNENKEIRKLIFVDPELAAKEKKIFALIRKSDLFDIESDGRIFQKRRLLDIWEEQFQDDLVLITKGEYEGKPANFKRFDTWNWMGLKLVVELMEEKEELLLSEGDISFVNPYQQRRWIQKEDVIPHFLQLANDIAGANPFDGKNINTDEEVDRRIDELKEKYGTLAVEYILYSRGRITALKKEVRRREKIFYSI